MRRLRIRVPEPVEGTLLALALLLCASCSCNEPEKEPFEACGPEVPGAVVQDFWVQEAAWAAKDVGFDLDGEDTQCESGCFKDSPGGIDSRFNAVLDGMRESLGPLYPESSFDLSKAIGRGDVTWLFRTRRGNLEDGASCLDVFYYNGVHTEVEGEYLVTRDSLVPGGSDLLRDARFRFDQGGEREGNRYYPRAMEMIVIRWTMPDGFEAHLRTHDVQMRLGTDGETMSGMLGGFILTEDWAEALQHVDLGDIDPQTTMNIVVNQADGDVVDEGPTDDECLTADDCPVPWRTCEDGFCYEHDDRMDSISATLVFEAAECVITGVAE